MKTKLTLLTLILILGIKSLLAQTSSSFKVGGDFDKFYPVTFTDDIWHSNIASELELGRSSVHEDSDWRGSLIARFRYHTTIWGNGSNFIDADIKQYKHNGVFPFIAGWRDVTISNGDFRIIVWLRGGNTTYYYKSSSNINPMVYDDVQNQLPYIETNGPSHSYKFQIDEYVNSNGTSSNGTIYANGSGTNYFNGNVGIGTTSPQEKLSVNGKIRAHEIKVETTNWPDYVFADGYKPTSLNELEKFIKINKHLPEVPAAKEAETKGVNLGEMNKLLLKKVEELTLHLIEKDNQLQQQDKRIQDIESKYLDLIKKLNLK